MREARIRIAAEWRETDLLAVKALGRVRPLESRRIDHPSAGSERCAGGLPHGIHRSVVSQNDLDWRAHEHIF
jgi:hypothetical protein